MDTFYDIFNSLITSLKYCNMEKEFYPFRDKIYNREEPKLFTKDLEYSKKYEMTDQVSIPAELKTSNEQIIIDEMEKENEKLNMRLKIEREPRKDKYEETTYEEDYECETCDEEQINYSDNYNEYKDKCYMGDSLPYPKRTKKELDDEMGEYWSRDIL